jgi:hypothetical protein
VFYACKSKPFVCGLTISRRRSEKLISNLNRFIQSRVAENERCDLG